MKNLGNFYCERNHMLPLNQKVLLSKKDEWHRKKDTGKLISLAKGTSQAEAKLNSDKIEPVTLFTI